MAGMLPFDANFRRKPQQNLGGCVQPHQSADIIIQGLDSKRKDRNFEKRKAAAVLTLQSFARTLIAQRRYIRLLAQLFEETAARCQQEDVFSTESCLKLLRLSASLRSYVSECPHFEWFCERLVRHQKDVSQWATQSTPLVFLQILRQAAKALPQRQPFGVYLRLLELYGNGVVLVHLLQFNYFESLARFAVARLPGGLEFTIGTKHQLGDTIVKLFLSSFRSFDKSLMLFHHEVLPLKDDVIGNYLTPALSAGLTAGELLATGPKVLLQLNLLDQEANVRLLSFVLNCVKSCTTAEMFTAPQIGLVIELASVLLDAVPPLHHAPDPVHQDEDSDDEDEAMDTTPPSSLNPLLSRAIDTLANATSLNNCPPQHWVSLTQLFYSLQNRHNVSLVMGGRFYLSYVFNVRYVSWLWYHVTTLAAASISGQRRAAITQLQSGVECATWRDIVPPLAIFTHFLYLVLLTLHDDEFHRDGAAPLSLHELRVVTAEVLRLAVGLIQLVQPLIRPLDSSPLPHYIFLFKRVSVLLSHLYARDCRKAYFVPYELWQPESAVALSWPTHRLVALLKDPPENLFHANVTTFITTEVRMLTQLTHMPYTVPFKFRYNLFYMLLKELRSGESAWSLRDMYSGNPRRDIHIQVRREFIYEDAFKVLSRDVEGLSNARIHVDFINYFGAAEAGIDGGGLYREFITQLVKTSFDPTRGLFLLTDDGSIYPNPGVSKLYSNFRDHYRFIGRVLGRVIIDRLLVDLPLAPFFLAKLLSPHTAVDIHHLASLDPDMYRSLLFLKQFKEEAETLGLDFTVMANFLGEPEATELIPGGADIAVTSRNKLQYIYAVSDYKLNRQLKAQCATFADGLHEVVAPQVLRLFTTAELQTLISGETSAIDLDDLKANTVYSPSGDDDRPALVTFWNVLRSLNEDQRREFLKFVTSCPRAPMFGFKELQPKFCVHLGDSDRLPTASTCVNLLKLPAIEDFDLLRERLLYSIESGAGFELS